MVLEEELGFSSLFFALEEGGGKMKGHVRRRAWFWVLLFGRKRVQKNRLLFFLSCSCMVFCVAQAVSATKSIVVTCCIPECTATAEIFAEYASSRKASVLSKLRGRKEAKMHEDDDDDEGGWRRRERNRRERSDRMERRQVRSEFAQARSARRERRGRSRQRRQRKPNGQEAASFARRWKIGTWVSTPHAERRVHDAAKSARVGTPWLRNIWMAGRKEGRVCNE